MTQYLNKTFTVAMGTGQAYRDNWDAIFGKKEEKPEPVKEPADNRTGEQCWEDDVWRYGRD